MFRPVTQADTNAVIRLIGEVWAEYDCVLDTDIEEKHLLDPGTYFRSRGGDFWVVEEDGRIVATVAVMFEDGVPELKSLYVAREGRRKGLGERLTRMVEDFARERGAKEIVLWSDTRFSDAHRLYGLWMCPRAT